MTLVHCLFSGDNYKRSNSSFLFSLNNKDNLPSFKADIKQEQHQYAIYCCADYGPTFGGGHDLHISNNANTNQKSYTKLNHTYQPPTDYAPGEDKTLNLLAGAYKFTPDEIEVFYWIFELKENANIFFFALNERTIKTV